MFATQLQIPPAALDLLTMASCVNRGDFKNGRTASKFWEGTSCVSILSLKLLNACRPTQQARTHLRRSATPARTITCTHCLEMVNLGHHRSNVSPLLARRWDCWHHYAGQQRVDGLHDG